MKRMFKFFVCAAILAAGITGCSSEEGPGPGPDPGETSDVVEGIPTYATFKFYVNGDVDGKAMPNDAGAAESTAVNDIRLLIYNAKDSCEANVLVDDAAHLAGGSPNAPKSATVSVTSGIKKIFVIANASKSTTLVNTALNAISKTGPTSLLSYFTSIVYDLDGGGSIVQAPLTKAPVADISTINTALLTLVDGASGKGLLMSNGVDANAVKTLVAQIDSITSADSPPSPDGGTDLDPSKKTNTFDITIQRAVAKARVTYHNTAALTTTDKSGILSEVKYVFMNVNRAVYPFQYLGLAVAPNPSTSGAALTAYPQSPYFENTYTENANEGNWKRYYYNYPIGELANMTDYATTASATYPAYYVTENTQQLNHAKGNSSYVAVEGIFQPAGNHYITGAYEIAGQDSLKLLGSNFTVPASRLSASPLSPMPTVLYQVRGGRGTITGIVDSMFFTDRNTAYKVAYLINCVNASLTSQLNAFDPTNWKKVPTGFTLADSLSYDVEFNNSPNVALVSEFTGGKCYYSIRFKDPTTTPSTGVKRNHYYQFDITAFNGIGQEQIGDTNKPPTTPTEEGDTYITATLKVDIWRNVITNVVPD
ncbi:MAG: Mfa1 family fimbria major subunit [Tannerella sp.]|jgi:hypothetical protein|nr:Mfa1 family fimbria major subunit [Tannerella sp.]